MAKKKKGGRRKQGLLSKAINAGLIAFAFMPVIKRFMEGGFNLGTVNVIIDDYTFGLGVSQSFDLNRGIGAYAPIGGAILLGKVKSYVLRKFPVR